MSQVIINKHIVANPSICHGKPVFRGTRVMVWQILDMLANGMSVEDIVEDFPSLTPEAINSGLHYASSITQQNYAIINTQPHQVSA